MGNGSASQRFHPNNNTVSNNAIRHGSSGRLGRGSDSGSGSGCAIFSFQYYKSSWLRSHYIEE